MISQQSDFYCLRPSFFWAPHLSVFILSRSTVKQCLHFSHFTETVTFPFPSAITVPFPHHGQVACLLNWVFILYRLQRFSIPLRRVRHLAYTVCKKCVAQSSVSWADTLFYKAIPTCRFRLLMSFSCTSRPSFAICTLVAVLDVP